MPREQTVPVRPRPRLPGRLARQATSRQNPLPRSRKPRVAFTTAPFATSAVSATNAGTTTTSVGPHPESSDRRHRARHQSSVFLLHGSGQPPLHIEQRLLTVSTNPIVRAIREASYTKKANIRRHMRASECPTREFMEYGALAVDVRRTVQCSERLGSDGAVVAEANRRAARGPSSNSAKSST